ncbi:sushi domain-containing protein 4 isoform X2 [Procambarus clarkii]|uniref:sushi domain-containing protein 4 isoform X2 n=1 Tax=Procambarus clarkii TaxID=6728 RepID=UPI00374207EE
MKMKLLWCGMLGPCLWLGVMMFAGDNCSATMISRTDVPRDKCDYPTLQNGKVIPFKSTYKVGETVTVQCSSGRYLTEGDSRLLCGVGGEWTSASILSSMPECQVLMCKPPVRIAHGSVQVIEHENILLGSKHHSYNAADHFPEGSVAEYSCDTGYWLHSSSRVRRTCHRGVWAGDLPQCVSQGCMAPEPVMNGYYIEVTGSSDLQYPPGATQQFVCHTGYVLHGPDLFVCKKAGEWVPRREPRCEPSKQLIGSELCAVPPEVVHSVQKLVRGVVTARGVVHGTTVAYRCHAGYRNVLAPCVAHSLTCHEGQWHGTSPECEEFSSCVAPPNIAHGFMYNGAASSYPLHSKVYYSCESGFRLVGPSVLTCDDTGCWTPRMPPVCQFAHHYEDGVESEKSVLDMHTILVATTGSVIGILLIVLALILYQRAVSPKLVRLHNSGSGNDLPPVQHNCSPNASQPQPEHDPDRVALIAFPDEGVPPTYEEAVRHRPAIMFEPHGGNAGSRYTPHNHRSRGHRVVVPGVRRSRHRDNPDNISYQSIGSARQSSSTSRSMSMRSWSACDSLGSTDTVAVSDSTNVTVDTQSSGGASSGTSQAPSCRALAGSLASFDTSSLVNNEGMFKST